MPAAFPARDAIDEALAAALVREQFPQWAGLTVAAVRESGNDHRTFRLGDALVARLPADLGFVPQVAKEQKYLPFLAPHLPVPIPAVVGVGRASPRFPSPWSVYGWLDGIRPDAVRVRDDVALAERLAHFLVALRTTDATGGPAPGEHSAFRGDPVSQWDEQVTRRFYLLDGAQRDRAQGVWRDALAAESTGPPVWVHGDVAIGNLLVDAEHRLSAVIDFGCSAVGDPACDTVIRWSQFRGPARRVFCEVLDLDDATWARGAGWTLWKGLIMLTNITPGEREFAERVLGEVLAR
ncbi:aminoglycoside phosphotransferase (APT) family kinase protein [Microbacterium sp. SORGH_AS 1204]|uniref:aminoglycoside phosphotransferase family protein n=1 Tax=Microbacterium sp. SORGH_AS_1204 TaxID=3041785 RepID=UPI00279121B1|nr:aminoglycoside phosphotransferase family protein [Microbacterium sp. SORGH_AS_1204]MDQ1136377.1 aminoglycoside phosphotransferase (APT) family kinase protein [Microbacterium sp. SORGH_AS_1204]